MCLIHPPVCNEVREANSVHRFNFITAGEGSLRLTIQKRRNERETGAGWELHHLLSNTLKLPLLYTQGKVFNLFHNRIHLKHLWPLSVPHLSQAEEQASGMDFIKQSGATEEHRKLPSSPFFFILILVFLTLDFICHSQFFIPSLTSTSYWSNVRESFSFSPRSAS